MQKRLLPFFVLAGVLFGFLILPIACSEDENPDPICNDPSNPDCPNYDPCLGANEVSADFLTETSVLVNTDSILWKEEAGSIPNSTVRFTANEDSAEYTWYLGAEKIEEKQFKRNFGNVLNGTPISISLVVRKAPDLVCNPDDDGYDSLTKVFIVNDNCNSPISNDWIGTFEDKPEDTLTISLIKGPQNVGGTDCTSLYITNLSGPNGGPNGSCTLYRDNDSGLYHSMIVFRGQSYTFETCGEPIGYARTDDNGQTILIECIFQFDLDGDGDHNNDGYDLTPKVFRGYSKN